MRIILASQSPYRQQQLKQLGLTFTVVAPHIDEDAAQKKISNPRLIAPTLAEKKGEKISELHPDSFIIAADQLVLVDKLVLGKPHTFARACEQLKLMSGKTHHLLTALWVKAPGRDPLTHLEDTAITLRDLSEQEIKNYVTLDSPLDSAGSYKMEKAGIALVEKMTCTDPSAILGLPLVALSRILRELNVPLFAKAKESL